ncbi:MAG: penicillin-insensitive murein endopeptidase [Myxococcota bacterium]|nr:penicillin-insensitive murein endopeptidase [Myxococcota bacterium]MEC8425304.1 penicillin-insensitive murein endopeptidase [Myxococcota bacterium]
MDLILSFLIAASPAHARPPGPLEAGLLAPPADPHGARASYESPATPCAERFLRGGTQLPRAPGLYTVWRPDTSWARPEMVQVLTATAEALAWARPDAAPLPVGDISKKGGGPLPGHASHRTGLDVDVGLYREGGRIHPYGLGDIPTDEIDVEVMWVVIREMMATGLVERILYNRHHIRRIKKHVLETGALTPEEADRMLLDLVPKDVWSREGVVQHHRGHHDHLHVRVRCDAVPTDQDTGP